MRKDVIESCSAEGGCRESSNRVQRQPYAPLSDNKGTDSVYGAASTTRSASQWYRQEGEPIHREEQLCTRVESVVLRRRFPANEAVPLYSYSAFSWARDGPRVEPSLWVIYVVPCVVLSKTAFCVANLGTF